MAARTELDVTVEEAGCLLYVADPGLAGRGFGSFYDLTCGDPDFADVLAQGAAVMVSLYQDDGYTVRVVLGDLTEQEQAEWTARATGRLHLPTGQMVLSGIITPDLTDDLPNFPTVTASGESVELGCRLEVPAGDYQATILSYPPNDLSGGWERLEDPEGFDDLLPGDVDSDVESPVDYFTRTRPGQPVPEWISEGFEDAAFLDFVVQLVPLAGDPAPAALEEDGCTPWEVRRPEICPLGIRLA
jgi:hypothetical protein